MAHFFDASTSVIHEGARSAPLRWSHGRRWLLWPALAWQVVALEPQQGSLNLFKRHALALCGVGVRRAEDIGERLAIGRELAAFILFQLQIEALVDEYGEPTRLGAEKLQDEKDTQLHSVSGYVFQDPFTSRLWPRFVAGSLNTIDATIRGLSAKFMPYDTKKKKLFSGRVVYPSASAGTWPPSTTAILRACVKSRQRRVAFERLLNPDRADEGSFSFDVGELHALTERISLIDDRPEPVFVTTFCFVPEDANNANLWQICDPFGLGISTELRAQIEGLIDRNDAPWLQQIIEQMTGQAYAVESADVYEMVAADKKQALEAVRKRLGDAELPSRQLLQRLVQMEERVAAASKYRHVGARGRGLRQSPLLSFIRRAYSAVEEVLAEVVDAYSHPSLVDSLVVSVEDNAHLLGAIATRIGFADDPDDACFDSLLRVSRGKVYAVFDRDNRELAAQVAAALLAANTHADHPFHEAARVFPRMLAFLERLKRQRDPAAHDMEGVVVEERVNGVLDSVYDVVGCLLPHVDVASDRRQRQAGQAPDWNARVMYRIRAQAVADVDRLHGLAVRSFHELRNHLVELEVIRLELVHLLNATSGEMEVTGRLVDLGVQGARATESSIKALIRTVDTEGCADDLADERGRNSDIYADIARGLGLDLGEDQARDVELFMSHPERVRAAAESQTGALSALTIVCLLSAYQSKEHPMRRIAAEHPSFLLDVAAVVKARGHGDAVSISSDDFTPYVDRVHAVAQSIIDGLS